eukprot:TRINITY_DN4928_c0_g1_i9.p1 TRINITY_DN4928_c0_g1~~TRINITY_DN4928_c0_g1_i9.p1  ORF type:complete len:307 (-),score=46.67 TRINITY_DN4928_c0_g1_i9:578-1498(-)
MAFSVYEAVCLVELVLFFIVGIVIVVRGLRWSSHKGPARACPTVFKRELWELHFGAGSPFLLLAVRAIVFGYFLYILISADLLDPSGEYYYFTEWNFTLVTGYFLLATCWSIIGCVSRDAHSNYGSDSPRQMQGESAGLLGALTMIVFQTILPLAVIVDLAFWLLLYVQTHAKFTQTTFVQHGVNLIALLVEFSLNSVRFPIFRMGYMLMFMATYVASQWVQHFDFNKKWAYDFLDANVSKAPYLYVGFVAAAMFTFSVFYWLTRLKFRKQESTKGPWIAYIEAAAKSDQGDGGIQMEAMPKTYQV